jgi:hypothetical protein
MNADAQAYVDGLNLDAVLENYGQHLHVPQKSPDRMTLEFKDSRKDQPDMRLAKIFLPEAKGRNEFLSELLRLNEVFTRQLGGSKYVSASVGIYTPPHTSVIGVNNGAGLWAQVTFRGHSLIGFPKMPIRRKRYGDGWLPVHDYGRLRDKWLENAVIVPNGHISAAKGNDYKNPLIFSEPSQAMAAKCVYACFHAR